MLNGSVYPWWAKRERAKRDTERKHEEMGPQFNHVDTVHTHAYIHRHIWLSEAMQGWESDAVVKTRETSGPEK